MIVVTIWIATLTGFVLGCCWAGRKREDDCEACQARLTAYLDAHGVRLPL